MVEIPSDGSAVALRLADGHEQVAQVVAGRKERVHVEPEIASSVGDEVHIAWVTHGGRGRRARGLIVSHAEHATEIEIVAVTELAGRFLRRFRPARQLIGELVLFDSFGQIRAEISGPVRDLALAGAGIEVAGVEEGEPVLLTIADESGHALVTDIEAKVVRVMDEGRGVITGVVFQEPFLAAPAIAALEAP